MSKILVLIQIHNKTFEPFLTAIDIDAIIANMSTAINQDNKDLTPLFIGVLNGSFMFVSDLMKKIDLDCELSFIKFQSYEGTSSSGDVKQMIGLETSIEGKDIIILEDIIDTGNTVEVILKELKMLNPRSIKIASLLFKSEVFDKKYNIDYIGKDIPNKFVVGFGLDYNGLGRNLKEIYQLA